MSEPYLNALADRYQVGFSRTQIAAEAAAVDAWLAFDSFAGDDEDEWRETFWMLTYLAASQINSMARVYLSRQLDAFGVGLPDGYPLSPEMGWFEEDFDRWATSPMVRSRWLVSEGMDAQDAIGDAATRVATLSSSVTRVAEEHAIRDLSDILQISEFGFELEVEIVPEQERSGLPRHDGRPRLRYRRITQQGACGFCRVAADRLYTEKAKEAHPFGNFHAMCRCTWRLTTEKEVQRWEPRYGGGEWRSVIKERATTSTGDTP